MKRELKMLISLSLVLTACLQLGAQNLHDKEAGQTLLSKHISESNAVVKYPEIDISEVRTSLDKDVAEMQAAMRDVEAFVARKGEQKRKRDFWSIEEQVVLEGKTVMRLVNFQSEKGPAIFALKSVFEGEGASRKEIGDQSYSLQFFPDGKAERFVTRGASRTDLRFYPSGGISEYYVITGKVAVISGRWEENGIVKHGKHKGPGLIINKGVP